MDDKQQVWIVTAGWEYEGSEVVGVFATQAKADAVKRDYDNTPVLGRFYQFVDVECFTVGEMAEELYRG